MQRILFYGTIMMATIMCGCATSRRLNQGKYQTITAPFVLDSSRLLRVQNIGVEVNTPAPEYAPSITANQKWLFFVGVHSQFQPYSRSGLDGGWTTDHDVWIADVPGPGDTAFSPPRAVAEGINSDLNEGALTTSADGTVIIFTGCDRADGAGDCDLYEAFLTESGKQQIRNIREINSPYWESQPAISSDGKLLFFASNRFGTMGGADIFMSRRNADGTWGPPSSVGAPINTSQEDGSPCLAMGDSVLFFASMGHGGFGSYDMFACTRQPGDRWSGPRNLGAVFNSPQDDRFISVAPDGSTFYYSSTRIDLPHAGSFDIFAVTTVGGGK